MRCFHGTTARGLRAILGNEGFKPNAPWNVCDNDGAMYVWPLNKVSECNGYDDDEEDYAIERGINQALEAGEVQAVVSGEDTIYCLVLDIHDDMLEDDYSCDNMSDQASFINIDEFKSSMIMRVVTTKLNKWNAPFIIAGMLGNEYFNQCSVDEDLLEIATLLSTSEYYRDPSDFEYTDFDY